MKLPDDGPKVVGFVVGPDGGIPGTVSDWQLVAQARSCDNR
jgi:hypothetical protein